MTTPAEPTRPLLNDELGRLFGVSESFASMVRRGKRFPSPKVQAAMVAGLGTTFEALNAALVAGKDGDLDAWTAYMESLSTILLAPRTKLPRKYRGSGAWVQRPDGVWLNLSA